MIFQYSWQAVLDGTKTQTRRMVKPGDYYCAPLGAVCLHRDNTDDYVSWTIDKTYAVQPGRGQKAVGRIRITGIRQERVQDISEADALAEGIEWRGHWTPGGVYDPPEWVGNYPPDDYAALWDTIHTKRGTRWNQNPECWVLCFKAVP